MSGNKNGIRYDEEFKKSIVALYQNGKTQSQLCREYGISQNAISKWVKQYTEIKTEDGDITTAKQIKELQKRNAQLEVVLSVRHNRLVFPQSYCVENIRQS